MKTTADIKSTAQRVLDAYHLDHQKYGVSTSLANVCRVLASTLVPHEDIDLLPGKQLVSAKQRALTRAQLLCLTWELEHVDVADEMVYAEQVVKENSMSDAVPTKAGSNGHVYKWITDRQPTEIDANGAGAVRIRKYPNGSSSAAVHWSFVGDGVPWQHCNDWNGIHSSDDVDRYVDEEGNDWRWADGAWHLVSEEPVPARCTTTLPFVRRQFLSISRAFGPHGEHYIDAVASDGTAWYQDLGLPTRSWHQHISLPEVTQ